MSNKEAPPNNANLLPLGQIQPETGSPLEIYKKAEIFIRGDDLLGWRQLLKQIRPPISKALMDWRSKNGKIHFKSMEQFYNTADEAINVAAPLFMMALAGIESGKDKFKDQRSLLDDLLSILGWNYSGLVLLADLPEALGFVYQGLHGAVCMKSEQPDLAIALADMKVPIRRTTELAPVWRQPGLIGWPASLGESCRNSWEFIYNGFRRWEWLKEIFEEEMKYHKALVAYYMALNITDLAEHASCSPEKIFHSEDISLIRVPLGFLKEDKEVHQGALAMLIRNPDFLRMLWGRWGISEEKMKYNWSEWLKLCFSWLRNVYSVQNGT